MCTIVKRSDQTQHVLVDDVGDIVRVSLSESSGGLLPHGNLSAEEIDGVGTRMSKSRGDAALEVVEELVERSLVFDESLDSLGNHLLLLLGSDSFGRFRGNRRIVA